MTASRPSNVYPPPLYAATASSVKQPGDLVPELLVEAPGVGVLQALDLLELDQILRSHGPGAYSDTANQIGPRAPKPAPSHGDLAA